MGENKIEFQCDKCGLCCIGLDKKEITARLHDGDGICRYLDRKSMHCTIYETRPIFCRVDEYYDMYLSDGMSREEYMRLTYEACELKKREWEECGRDIRKMGQAEPEMGERMKTVIGKSLRDAGKEGK